MANWNFAPEHPVSLTLAADARFGPTSYTNDHIWELSIGSAEPPALSLQTTYGLRARTCRIFPRFILDGQAVSDPAHFYRPIIIRKYFPNYICLSFKPFSSVNVEIEYWVPGSQVIGGRTTLTNLSQAACQVQVDWAVQLIPAAKGSRMATHEIELSTILAGHTSDLSPTFFLTGGVQAGNSPYPSLNLAVDLPPRGQQESRWVNASLDSRSASFSLAKEVMHQNWEAEFARVQRINSQALEITTGNQDWNTVLYLSQTIAHQLVIQPDQPRRPPSYVYSRHPDQGYSLRKDGTDYSHLWNGQTPFDSYYLSYFLLPASPALLKGILDNFFSTQTSQGEIDWKPGMAGQRSQLLATPLLCSLAWRYYQYTRDKSYIENIFPQLSRFYFSWFTAAHDRDNDMFPEWDQAVQTGYEEHPLFSLGDPGSTVQDISTVEGPDLAAYLYHDGQALISMAKLLGEDDTQIQCSRVTDQLKESLEESWSEQLASYLYRDRDSHYSNPGTIIGRQMGSGIMQVHQEYQLPVRPIVLIKSLRERTQPLQVYIHGVSPAGAHRVDHIPSHRVRWHLGSGNLTSDFIYQSIEQIEISGILEDVEVVVSSADLTELDQTLLLPLWAGIPSEERARVLANLTILNKNRFLSAYGVRSTCPSNHESDLNDHPEMVNLQWNCLVMEGLLRYGTHKMAAEIFTRLMKAELLSFQQELKFYGSFNSGTGKPVGPANTLDCLPPVGLFLKILGVNIIDPFTVEITHENPFPWPVTIKYCGLAVAQQEKKAVLIFPDGQTVSVDNDHPQVITARH